jgi:hypothetical protein
MVMLNNILHNIFPPSHPALAAGARRMAGMPAAAQASGVDVDVDVEAILNDKAQLNGQPISWRTSIVDLLSLLNLDSSLQSRKELAKELYYSGDTSSPASMNVWLHRQVMTKLAQNGGTVPADLKD